jgi:site-specific recombinase XerD
MPQKRKRKNWSIRTVLRLPDLDHSKASVLQSLGSAASKRTYGAAIEDFISWYCSEPRLAFGRTVVLRYRYELEARHLAPATINVRLAAVRRLAYEASDNGLLNPDLAAGIRRVKGAKRLGLRLGNWLTADQGRSLLAVSSGESVRDKRDYAILALLLGCGLRRAELIGLTFGHLQQRDNHWAIVNLYGKGGHVRTVPIPAWVKAAVDRWLVAGDITSGLLFRRVSRTGTIWASKISEKLVWWIVKQRAAVIGIEKLAPHDLRRTCARLCHAAGGELEQIQFLLGLRSVETTERYLGSRQRIASAVNDCIGLEPAPAGKQQVGDRAESGPLSTGR